MKTRRPYPYFGWIGIGFSRRAPQGHKSRCLWLASHTGLAGPTRYRPVIWVEEAGEASMGCAVPEVLFRRAGFLSDVTVLDNLARAVRMRNA